MRIPESTTRDYQSLSQQLLVTTKEAAALCSIAVRTWRMRNAAGKIPRAIHIGRLNYWRPEELKAWVAAECPDRVTWEAVQQL